MRILRLLMLGRDYTDFGRISESELGDAVAAISVGVASESGEGFGAFIGDCTLAVLSGEEYRGLTEQSSSFFYFGQIPQAHQWGRFRFQLQAQDLLLLHTDGINECHYRQPETSVQPHYIVELWKQAKPDNKSFSRSLMSLALQGVNGHPGGQDNIALIALLHKP